MRALALLLVAVLLCLFSVMMFASVKVARAPRHRARARPPAAPAPAGPPAAVSGAASAPRTAAPNGGASIPADPAVVPPGNAASPTGPAPGNAPAAPGSSGPPATRDTVQARHPLVQALYAAAEPQVARERGFLDREQVAAATGDTVGYRRWGNASFRVSYRITPTGTPALPYRAGLTLTWTRLCSEPLPSLQQATLAPLRRTATGATTLSYAYQNGAWSHQGTERQQSVR